MKTPEEIAEEIYDAEYLGDILSAGTLKMRIAQAILTERERFLKAVPESREVIMYDGSPKYPEDVGFNKCRQDMLRRLEENL